MQIFIAFQWVDTLPIFSLAAAGAGALAAWFNYGLAKDRERKELHIRLNEIIKLSMAYPHVEDKVYIRDWRRQWQIYQNDNTRATLSAEQCTKLLQYDYFADLLFNYLVEVHKHFKGDKDKIENFVGIRDWVRLHETHWKQHTDDHENVDSYDKKFRDFINSYFQ